MTARKRPRSPLLIDIRAPDPLDVGALLDAACKASGLTNATIAALAHVDPGNLSRARRNANARPELARRVLAALGARVAMVPPPRPLDGPSLRAAVERHAAEIAELG